MNSSQRFGCLVLVTALLASALSARAAASTPPVPPADVGSVVVPVGTPLGLVQVHLAVDATGRPHNIRVASVCDRMLEEELRSLVAQWRFTPATRDGKPVPVEIIIPVELAEKKVRRTG